MPRTLPITDAELHYELDDAGVADVAEVEIKRMKDSGWYAGLSFEIEEIDACNSHYGEERYTLQLRVCSTYKPNNSKELRADGEFSSSIAVEKVPYDLEQVQILIDRERSLGKYLEERLGEPLSYDADAWQVKVNQMHTALENQDAIKVSQLVYAVDGHYYSAECPVEKSTELSQAIQQIFGVTPKIVNRSRTL